MKDLHLNLKKEWFDMILSGEKTEEYREVKPSIVSLLFDWRKIGNTRDYLLCTIKNDHDNEECWSVLKNIDNIIFSNGYSKNRRQMKVKLDSVKIIQGLEEWGAKKGEYYFTLSLGAVTAITKKNEV